MSDVSQGFKQWLIAILLLIFSGSGIVLSALKTDATELKNDATKLKTDVAEHKTDVEIHKQAKQLMAQFAKTLKAELMQAVKQGGLLKGVQVCSEKADGIADELSVDGWQIKRVSLKNRNPDNAPDEWETLILQDFDKRNIAGEPAKELFVSQEGAHKTQGMAPGTNQFRAMKAIPTQALCLNCHGTQLAPGVADTIQQYYPDDKATGYAVGDIRGAFSLTKHR